MEQKTFHFAGIIQGKPHDFAVTVPTENGGVYTNRFCPPELITGGQKGIPVINGESEEEFIADCQRQVIGMSAATKEDSCLDVHIAGFMAVVMDHISRFNRLIFGDLLIYMDCFSLLLDADGFAEEDVKSIYPRVIKSIVDLYPDHIKNTADGETFAESHSCEILKMLTNQ